MPAARRLAAILAADVVGYSRLMGADEEGTVRRLKSLRAGLIDPTISKHNGRIVHTVGDGLLVEFQSVVDAMRCAIEWQGGISKSAEPDADPIQFRIGVNLGDVIIDDDDIHGDGVNIAARLEAMSEPGGICISRTVLTHTRGKLDFPVADLGEQALKNICQPVHVFHVLADEKPMPEPAALPLPDKPSIAVLPFQNMSGDPEQEYFADGMVEEIITALSQIRWLFVIARNSSFSYKGQSSPDTKQVSRELGVRYVLEGSVRKVGNRVRITAQLIDAPNGTHLWAGRFDGSIEDIFELQDKVALGVAGVIEPALQAAEARRSAARPTTDLSAYDLHLRALSVFWILSKEAVLEALDICAGNRARSALWPRLTPSFSRGWFVSGILRNWAGQHDLAIEHAETSMRLSPRERRGTTLSVIAEAYFFKREFDEAVSKLLLSIQDHPGYPHSYRILAACYAHMGRLDEARAVVDQLRALTPQIVPSASRLRVAVRSRAVFVGPAPSGGRDDLTTATPRRHEWS